jgi:hypothetical protein
MECKLLKKLAGPSSPLTAANIPSTSITSLNLILLRGVVAGLRAIGSTNRSTRKPEVKRERYI